VTATAEKNRRKRGRGKSPFWKDAEKFERNSVCPRDRLNRSARRIAEVFGAAMNETDFQSKLAELMGEISTLPPSERQKLEKIATETRERHERLRQTVSSLQESLDYLRLSIKYLVFDLEATRRENGYLRKILEETTGND